MKKEVLKYSRMGGQCLYIPSISWHVTKRVDRWRIVFVCYCFIHCFSPYFILYAIYLCIQSLFIRASARSRGGVGTQRVTCLHRPRFLPGSYSQPQPIGHQPINHPSHTKIFVGIHSSEVDYLNCRLFCISQLAPHKIARQELYSKTDLFCDSIG